ncbi:MAG: hypothetical protein Q4B42_04675, partial [Oscillospiraceae bacterium]|nr:hypothetical protein [Oscillospiraceae bacterium]
RPQQRRSWQPVRRSRSSTDSQQCYFTARSVALAVAEAIVNDPDCGLLPAAGATLDELEVEGLVDESMGECAVRVERSGEGTATVTATATRRGAAYSYSVRLAAETIVVPKFEGGLHCKNLWDGSGSTSAYKSVSPDVYITGSGTQYIDFPVSGNVFAPYADVVITAQGGVAGTVISSSLTFNVGSSSQFVPTTVITKGASSQNGISGTLTKSYLLSESDYNAVVNRFMFIQEGQIIPEDLSIGDPEPGTVNDRDKVFTAHVSQLEVLENTITYVSASNYEFRLESDSSLFNSITLLPSLFSSQRDVNIFCVSDSSLSVFGNPSNFIISFYIDNGVTLTLSDTAFESFRNATFYGASESTLELNISLYDYNSWEKNLYVGTVNSNKEIITLNVTPAQQASELCSVGWEIVEYKAGS